MNISVESPRPLPVSHELILLRAALARSPDAITVRSRLVRLLLQSDAFDEIVDLLSTDASASLPLDMQRALAGAWLARGTPADAASALDLLDGAMALNITDDERADLLADRAKALLRLDKRSLALETLRQALDLKPDCIKALHRLGRELLMAQQARDLLSLTGDLLSRGVMHTRLLSLRTLAYAGSGDLKAARELAGLSCFLHQSDLPAPRGWDNLAAFNSALALELAGNRDLRYGRYGTASVGTWRVDDPATGDTPAVRSLLALIAARATAFQGSLGRGLHPWASARPKQALLRCWSVMVEGDGFEQWHTHPEGWLSGVYYVQVPNAVSTGKEDDGCLVLGLPEGLIGSAAALGFGQTRIRPVAGRLVLFPSHTYHRTFAHRSEGTRLCIAFDVCPR